MKTLSSIISQVTVYPDRAQVTRIAKEKISKGSSELIFDFLPNTIEEQSIQVKGSPNFSIKEIQFKEVHYEDFPQEKYAQFMKEREEILDEITKNHHEKLRIENEISFLKGIQTKLISPAEETSELDFNVKNWEGMMLMSRTKSQELHSLLFENEAKRKLLDNKKNRLDSEMMVLFGGSPESPGSKGYKKKKQISVLIESDAEHEIEIKLLYIVKNVSWAPSYDVKVDTLTKKINLLYYAQITQNTQEDWKDAAVRVTTAKPALNKQLATNNPWLLLVDAHDTKYNQPAVTASLDKMMEEAELPAGEGMGGKGGPAMLTSKVQSGATSVFYDLPGKYTILSGDKKHKATIDDCELSSEFNYSMVTSAGMYHDNYVYLQAEIRNTTGYALLAGAANIYLDGDFMRTTNLLQTQAGETLSLSLGADEAIILKNPDYFIEEKKEGLFNKKKKLSFTKEIYLKNTRQSEFLFIIKDNFPISPNKEVVVELLKPVIRNGDDSLTKNDTNLLEWKFTLKAGEEKKIPIHFTIEHPLQYEVYGF